MPALPQRVSTRATEMAGERPQCQDTRAGGCCDLPIFAGGLFVPGGKRVGKGDYGIWPPVLGRRNPFHDWFLGPKHDGTLSP